MRRRRLVLDADDIPDGEPGPLQKLAGIVRDMYCHCYLDYTGRTFGGTHMPAWDGGTDQWGRRSQSVWPKIATKIVEVGADPISFVRAQFGTMQGRQPPRPNQLLHESAVAAWQTFAYTGVEELVSRRQREELAVRRTVYPLVDGAKWEHRRALGYALTAPFSEVAASPLYRYCCAVSNEFPEIAERFEAKAVLQYALQQADYDIAWRDLLPESLIVKGRELRAQFLSG